MSDGKRGTIEGDNAQLRAFAEQVTLAMHLPSGSEPHRLAQTLGDLPSLPDRFNAVFLEHGWIFVEFACGYEPAECALKMYRDGAAQTEIDDYLAGELLGIERIKWQSLKVLGGGMVDPLHPVRASIVERVVHAYEAEDHLVVVPLVLMLVDGFGVSATGTKSMFADLEELDDMFQSSESVAGHPSALKVLLMHLRRGQRGYSEQPLTMPLRNGILHGTRLNYASPITAAKAINLLAAVVEWARDVAPEPRDEVAKREWNVRFLRSNLTRLNPSSPQRALELLQTALIARRAADIVALIGYHPVFTLLSEEIMEWRKLEGVQIGIESLDKWELFGQVCDPEQYARCRSRLSVIPPNGTVRTVDHLLHAKRSVELARAQLPSVWQIDLGLMGAIRRLLPAS